MSSLANENSAESSSANRSNEHLKDLADPIKVHVATFNDARKRLEVYRFNIDDLGSSATEVYFNPRNEFIISPVNDENKFTPGLANCTCVVVIGTDRITGKNISFITHQSDPKMDDADPFRAVLTKSLTTISGRCVDGTIDAIIAGGAYTAPVRERDYKNTIIKLDETIRETLGFEPFVALGPKIDLTNNELVYCDTKNKEVYVMRSELNGESVMQGFHPSELGRLSLEWPDERRRYRESIGSDSW